MEIEILADAKTVTPELEMHHDFDKNAYSPIVVVCVRNVDVRKETT